MKTTIQINGLDVEFSDQKPTRPCACWRIKQMGNVTYGPELAWVEHGLQTGKLIDNGSNKAPYIDDLYKAGWRFSAPLVPVTEVEKGYKEGHWHGSQEVEAPFSLKRVAAIEDYGNSNARKVVEGVR